MVITALLFPQQGAHTCTLLVPALGLHALIEEEEE
jgi:hypothetical protein